MHSVTVEHGRGPARWLALLAVEARGLSLHRSVCSCGWKGRWRRLYPRALQDGHDHQVERPDDHPVFP